MRLYDISQELLSSAVYPGDPSPTITKLSSMDDGDLYNLTSLSMCAHNGTHIDAPAHFIKDGDTVSEVDISKTVGECFVAEGMGIIGKEEAENILERARMCGTEHAKMLLLKGDITVTPEAAYTFYRGGVSLLGVLSQSVGPINAPMEVHKILLGADVILLEGLRLGAVRESGYFLFAAPINIAGADGSPCRAVLVDFNN